MKREKRESYRYQLHHPVANKMFQDNLRDILELWARLDEEGKLGPPYYAYSSMYGIKTTI